MGDAPQVLAFGKGGPAEKAGLRVDDVLLAADGLSLAEASTGRDGSSEVVEHIWAKLDQAFVDGAAQLEVQRGRERISLTVEAVQGCASRFQLAPSPKLNARATGDDVVVTTAIMMFVQNDNELAAVLAHELSHNILDHQAKKARAGRRWNQKAAEVEADRLSVHLLNRAGFDPSAAVSFWTRLRPSRSIFAKSDHPSWHRRVKILQGEIAELEHRRGAVASPAANPAAEPPKP